MDTLQLAPEGSAVVWIVLLEPLVHLERLHETASAQW